VVGCLHTSVLSPEEKEVLDNLSGTITSCLRKPVQNEPNPLPVASSPAPQKAS
jgi:hypothetical protein